MWPFLIALTGYVVAHLLNGWRDRRAKQREIRAKFLIETYSALAKIITSEKWDFEALQRVLADIQLMGSTAQIAEAHRLAQEFPDAYAGKNGGIVDIEPLLREIRKDLRADLSMTSISSGFIWVGVTKKTEQP